METFEFALVVLGCIIASSIIARCVARVALPLVQIAIGFVVALLLPSVLEVQLGAELFLVLFIAPLLFDETRHVDLQQLWANKASVLSLAIGLVVLTVVAVGVFLHCLVPAIPLAAAFACAAALAPTDAAAVSAMASVTALKPRQRILLSGESLVNDASGVVSFQMAVAAVMTGTFSLLDATESFALLFLGGVAFGAAVGVAARQAMKAMRRFGYEDTLAHVLYQVLTPFFVFLLAEWVGVSGILAVVAAGVAMRDDEPELMSYDAARRQFVSDNFWKVIVYLINGTIFVMLGMQLPLALAPTVAQAISVPMLIAVVAAITLALMACRFLWVFCMEILHRVVGEDDRGYRHPKEAFKDALVMTVSGPKGAVTLSMIFTIPIALSNGEAFPQRDLIIFVAAGVILTSLVVANVALPLLAPKRASSNEELLHDATIAVLEETLSELQRRIAIGEPQEYIPALRLAEARYQTRLTLERERSSTCGKAMAELSQGCLAAQQRRADELQRSEDNHLTTAEAVPYYAALRSIRGTVGYVGDAVAVGARFYSPPGKLRLLGRLQRPVTVMNEKEALVYYDTCLFAMELERAAIDYLQEAASQDPVRKRAAEALIATHQAVLESIGSRISFGKRSGEGGLDGSALETELGPHERLPKGVDPSFGKQIMQARRHADDVAASALTIELDNILHLQEAGRMGDEVARTLRQRVYALQSALEGA